MGLDQAQAAKIARAHMKDLNHKGPVRHARNHLADGARFLNIVLFILVYAAPLALGDRFCQAAAIVVTVPIGRRMRVTRHTEIVRGRHDGH